MGAQAAALFPAWVLPCFVVSVSSGGARGAAVLCCCVSDAVACEPWRAHLKFTLKWGTRLHPAGALFFVGKYGDVY